MPRWTIDDAINFASRQTRAKPERLVQNERDGALEGEKKHTASILVRVTAFRCIPLDPDNLCPKYFVDCLRYGGYIPDDTPDKIRLEVRQIKTAKKKDDHTLIEVIHDNPGKNPGQENQGLEACEPKPERAAQQVCGSQDEVGQSIPTC